MAYAFSGTLLGKHIVAYYHCLECGFIRTEAPYWLDEAYAAPISELDTGMVARNIANAQALELLLVSMGRTEGPLLDVAGGYGLLTRLMRDRGFDCYTTDEFCPNLFARSLEPGPGFKAHAMFAFEVLEHVEDPVIFLRDMFERFSCRTLLFSTETYKGGIPGEDWWYYARETGQHVAFYQARTLARLAEHFGCEYYRTGLGLHLITDGKAPWIARVGLSNRAFRTFYGSLIRRRRAGLSRTWGDYLDARNRFRDIGVADRHPGHPE
jgi:hypothetical protein